MRQRLTGFRRATWQEIGETGDLLHLLARVAVGQKLDHAERARALDQIRDLSMLVPAFSIFLLPGGALLIPIAARLLPWRLVPSAFADDDPLVANLKRAPGPPVGTEEPPEHSHPEK